MKLKICLNLTAVTIGLALTSGASATDVTTGKFVLNFDEAALLSLPAKIVHSAWYDEAASADKTATELRKAPSQESAPDSFSFNVFGATVSTPPKGLKDRKPVASTFSYTGDPTTGTGKIGLAGAHQITGDFKGSLISGDYGLSYDTERIGNESNGSGWLLTNYIGFTLPAYDLTNVTTTIIDDDNFSLSGDVVFTDSNAAMMLTETGIKAGTFTFTTVASGDAIMPAPSMSATFTAGTNLLMLPSINVGGTYYKATLQLVAIDGKIAFDLKPESIVSAAMTGSSAEFSPSTGILTIPMVELLDNNGNMTGSIENQSLTLEEGSSPFRFIY